MYWIYWSSCTKYSICSLDLGHSRASSDDIKAHLVAYTHSFHPTACTFLSIDNSLSNSMHVVQGSFKLATKQNCLGNWALMETHKRFGKEQR